jgi:Flp pilus assembly pilin Flp
VTPDDGRFRTAEGEIMFRTIRTVRHPATDFLVAFLRSRAARARSAGGADRGASAIEWVIIAAVVVGIVAGVAAVIMNALDDRAESVGDCIEGAQDYADC